MSRRVLAVVLLGGLALLVSRQAAASVRPVVAPRVRGSLGAGEALASSGGGEVYGPPLPAGYVSGGRFVPVSGGSVSGSGAVGLREIPRAPGVPIWEAAKNPGNIRFSAANDWVGQVGWVVSASGARFAAFSGFEYGLRAAAIIIGRDIQAGKTLRQIVYEFAPPHENNADEYMARLSASSGVRPDEVPSLWKLGAVVAGIALLESGRDFSALMSRSLAMTGFGSVA